MLIKYISKISNTILNFKIKFMSREQYTTYLRKRGMHIGTGCDISKSILVPEPWLIWIGNNVRLTRNVQLITHDGSLWTLRKLGYINQNAVKYGRIFIGDNTNIGWDVKILPGVHIGKNCIIGAGAIVTRDIPDGSVVAGVPARIVNTVNVYAEKVINDTHVHPTMRMTEFEKIDYIKKNDPRLLI